MVKRQGGGGGVRNWDSNSQSSHKILILLVLIEPNLDFNSLNSHRFTTLIVIIQLDSQL